MLNRLAVGLINFFVGVTEVFLALRFVLELFEASPSNQFVNWVYSSTGFLLQPFRGIFPSTVIGHHHVVDFTTLFAMAVYAVFGMLLVWLVSLFAPRRVAVKK